ncbi:hypothetical protein L1049_006622 [Liquidambar formosana]|uniref:RRM domain-containing protein n=1 Tax=Liquidambar formosana TaxID=63359 RepID=A0AAP0RHG6_LIQFO
MENSRWTRRFVLDQCVMPLYYLPLTGDRRWKKRTPEQSSSNDEMLGGWGFPAPCNSQTLLTTTPHSTTSFSLLLPQKPHQTHLSFFLNATSSFSLLKGRTGFSAFALKKRIKDKKNVLEMDGFDDGDDDIGDDEDEEDDEGVFIPLGNMNKWLENKPRGFGEGKEYDTSIEDKLLEEMEQSGQAQLVNIRKLKNNTVQPTSQKDHPPEQKATKIIPSGIRVRLLNLPKKKNIHRDLQSAFKGVPGIVNIAPAVSGNKKTRHPVCKGFAFVDLKSEQDANRFIQIVSKQSITFGKIQKLIKCEITNSRSPDSTSEQSTDDTYTSPQVTDPALEADSPTDFDIVDSSLDSVGGNCV